MKKILSLILVAIMLVTAMPMVFAEGNTYKVGDIVQFGSYPQSKVTDETLIAELNSLASEWKDWTSYGYYSGSDDYGTMKSGNWMRYIDISCDDNRYRGVKFSEYRPSSTFSKNPIKSSSHQGKNGYEEDIIYWFNFDPINWRVIDPNRGLVMCETIIDSQPYNNHIYKFGNDYVEYKYSFFGDKFYKNFANDYVNSSIRQWLNNEFYNTAFTKSEHLEIADGSQKNKSYYTLIGKEGYQKLDSNTSYDKIFLLSYDEVIDKEYGFSTSELEYDKMRKAYSSDYAKSQGLNVNKNKYSAWLLRTPGIYSDSPCVVFDDGSTGASYYVSVTYNGIRPALFFNDISNIGHEHSYDAVVSSPTCTVQGYITYICECGDTYVADYVKEKGHSFTNYISDGKATCSVDGSLTAKCDNCDVTDTKPERGAHKFSSSFTIDIEPTCTSFGSKSRHCINCTEKTDVTRINKLSHSFTVSAIQPTCTQNGLAFYSCPCGYSYTETIPAKGHSFDGSACTNCDYDKADTCGCNCHKGGIAGLIFKIILIFQKIFKSNSVCSCGARHY